MSGPSLSVCLPAHNEEKLIEATLRSIQAAAEQLGEPVEIVICLNRCTDGTEEIARRYGAVIVRNDEKCIAKVRNTAVAASRGRYVATIDADSRMSLSLLREIKTRLDGANTVGGGVAVIPERLSLGICLSGLLIAALLSRNWISAGVFWLRRADFDRLGGFDESILTGEDLDFAYRLKALGKERRQPFRTIMKAGIITSCRKFDHFGDWYLLRSPALVRGLLRGRDRRIADRYYHDFPR